MLVLFGWYLYSQRNTAPRDAATKRVAVLPFRDLSPGENLQWLADGLQVRLVQIIGSSAEYQIIPTPLASRMLESGSVDDIDLLIAGTLQQELD